MTTRLPNGDVKKILTGSEHGPNYQKVVNERADNDWVLIDHTRVGDFWHLIFRYKKFVLRPTPAGLKLLPGQKAIQLPHPNRFLTREEANQVASEFGDDKVIAEETEPPAEPEK